jgi:hypothetical protein
LWPEGVSRGERIIIGVGKEWLEVLLRDCRGEPLADDEEE